MSNPPVEIRIEIRDSRGKVLTAFIATGSFIPTDPFVVTVRTQVKTDDGEVVMEKSTQVMGP